MNECFNKLDIKIMAHCVENKLEHFIVNKPVCLILKIIAKKQVPMQVFVHMSCTDFKQSSG